MKKWQGKQVLVIGAARQGLAITRFLLQKGAMVIINDCKPVSELKNQQEELAGLPVKWVLGCHPLEILAGIDLVIVSGGVPLELPLIQEAFRKDIPVSNDSQIFMELVPAKVIGITGSAGKTTTTVLVGEIAKAAVKTGQQVWVGGNIGLPLVDHLEKIRSDDWVVMELSSFQLDLMTISPHISAVLNITPNHLDRHLTMQAYTHAKAKILLFQKEKDFAVLNRENIGSWNLSNFVAGKLISFGLNQPVGKIPGTFLENKYLRLQNHSHTTEIMSSEKIQLRGTHNLLNALAACAIAHAAGFSAQAMCVGISNVTGIAHRLEYVRDWHGVQWVNDSIATAPERTIAAILSFKNPLILLLGGRDKKLPWDELASLVHRQVKHVILFGEAIELITRALGNIQHGEILQTITQYATLKEAVAAAAELASPGDVVLLAPGGTSFDEFTDFEERGNKFKEWVNALK